MQSNDTPHQSNTTLFHEEYQFIWLLVSIHRQSSSDIRTKPLKHSSLKNCCVLKKLKTSYECDDDDDDDDAV